MNSCYNCKYLSREYESWELQHIQWWECWGHAGRANLRSFPFKNTKCKLFAAKDSVKTRYEILQSRLPKHLQGATTEDVIEAVHANKLAHQGK